MRGPRAGWLCLCLSCAIGSAAFGGGTGRAVFVAFLPTEHVAGVEDLYDAAGVVGKTAYRYHARDSVGVGFEYSQRFFRWIGYTASFSWTKQTYERREHTWLIDPASGAVLGESDVDTKDTTVFAPLLVGFDFHMLPEGRFDLYTGPMFGYSYYDTLFGGKVDNHFITGLSLGLDVDVGTRWALSATARYIDAEVEPQPKGGPTRLLNNGETSNDPVQLQLGVVYRFGGAAR